MRAYDFYLIGDDNGYGQRTLIRDDEGNPLKQGELVIGISTLTQSVTDDLRYSDSTYIGLTHDKTVNDNYIIQHGSELLKVQYVNKDGRYIQVFLGAYNG
jgi:hypothetical protein